MRGYWAIAGLLLLRTLPGSETAAQTIYVSNEKGNSITVIDGKTLEVTATVDVGQRPRGMRIFSTNGVSNDISVIDVETRKVIKSITVGRFPWGVAVKG